MSTGTVRDDARTNFRYLVVLAASAGGLQAFSSILSMLPAEFLAPIVLVQHLSPDKPSLLPVILGRRSLLTVKEAQSGDSLCIGTVYVAPPDSHLLFKEDGSLALSQSIEVHFVRPSADVLFKSAAAVFKEKVIAVVLTGSGSDGSGGVGSVKDSGGMVIAQDQSTSEHFGMPQAAILTGKVDYVLPLNKIGAWLIKTIMAGAP